MTEPCPGCELRNSCMRDGRCYRPRTPDYLVREYEKAAEAYDIAAKNLMDAAKAVQQILKEGTL